MGSIIMRMKRVECVIKCNFDSIKIRFKMAVIQHVRSLPNLESITAISQEFQEFEISFTTLCNFSFKTLRFFFLSLSFSLSFCCYCLLPCVGTFSSRCCHHGNRLRPVATVANLLRHQWTRSDFPRWNWIWNLAPVQQAASIATKAADSWINRYWSIAAEKQMSTEKKSASVWWVEN